MSKNRLPIFGLVEGFYGVFYTFPERDDLIRFLGEHGFNFYLYAPKNDRQHRARWREPYPPKIMAQFAQTAAAARQAGIDFCYGISPGVSIRYSADEDFTCLLDKLAAFQAAGVHTFALLLDDLKSGFAHPEDAAAFASTAQAQAGLANRLLSSLVSRDPRTRLLVCPGEYFGSAPFSPSLIELASCLDPAIGLFYTGPEVCSPAITVVDAADFAAATGREPILWDNYPVNDLDMQAELHLGAVTGRDPGLLGSTSGILINPMIQAEASKIPLLTYAAFAANPKSYDPTRAWVDAAQIVAGDENVQALNVLMDCAQISTLHPAHHSELSRVALAGFVAMRKNEDVFTGPAALALEDYLTCVDEACYQLKFRLDNLPLRNNLLPWIELLEHWMWMTRRGLDALRSRRQGLPYQDALDSLKEYKLLIERHPKRIAEQPLMQLAEWIIEQVEQPIALAPVEPDPTRKRVFRLPRRWPTWIHPVKTIHAS